MENTAEELAISTLPPLWEHQRIAIEKASRRFAFFFDPGCGKSRTVLSVVEKNAKEHRRKSSKVTIIAPINVCRNWLIELKKYYGSKYTTYLVAGQTAAKKLKTLQEFAKSSPSYGSQILIINIEALRNVKYRGLVADSLAETLIVDESHNFKTPTSQQTKGLIELKEKLKPTYIYLLTGTPAPQGEIDLWSTFYLLDKTNLPFFIWRKRYFIDKNERRRGTHNYWPEYVVDPKAKEIFVKLLSECSLTAQKDLVLDLPPLLRTTVFSEMSTDQARHYESMKQFLFAIDEQGNELNASNLLSRTLRLQQILAGFIGNAAIKNNPRLDALKFAIEKCCDGLPPHQSNSQLIIWTIFKSSYKQIAELLQDLGISYGMLTGEQSADSERPETIARFQAGEIRAVIAHPKVVSEGVNLTAAAWSIHYTRSYNLVHDLQCEARNYRGGSEIHGRITRIDIITPGTIDEEIAVALQQKKKVQEFILGLKR